MKKFLIPVAISALLVSGCTRQPTGPVRSTNNDQAFVKVHDEYVVEFLRRNPTVNTYLGGAGLDPKLKEVDGTLRDHSVAALQDEDRWLRSVQQSLDRIDPDSLSAANRI